MLNIAHRGFRSKYPENTMIAFKKAFEAGADGVEFDVHLTKDGEVVIIHDERIDRTTDGKGRVQDYTYQELRQFNAAKGFELDKEEIPLLEEYLEYVKDMDIVTNIELKTGVYSYLGIEDKVNDLLKKYELEDKVIISSFNHFSILRMKKINPNLQYGLLTDSWMHEPWNYLNSLEVKHYHPSGYGMSEDLIRGIHENGLCVNVWFGSERWDFEDVIKMGVDAIITDYPDEIDEIKKKLIK
ncbi:glycerophosphodiester phosphodiesterase [Peptoniphilus asaccharolyticus]